MEVGSPLITYVTFLLCDGYYGIRLTTRLVVRVRNQS